MLTSCSGICGSVGVGKCGVAGVTGVLSGEGCEVVLMCMRVVEEGGNIAMLGRVVVCASGGRNEEEDDGGAGGCGG